MHNTLKNDIIGTHYGRVNRITIWILWAIDFCYFVYGLLGPNKEVYLTKAAVIFIPNAIYSVIYKKDNNSSILKYFPALIMLGTSLASGDKLEVALAAQMAALIGSALYFDTEFFKKIIVLFNITLVAFVLLTKPGFLVMFNIFVCMNLVAVATYLLVRLGSRLIKSSAEGVAKNEELSIV